MENDFDKKVDILFDKLLNKKDMVVVNGILIHNNKAIDIVKNNSISEAMTILDTDDTVAIYELADCGTDVFEYVVNRDECDLAEDDYIKLINDTN